MMPYRHGPCESGTNERQWLVIGAGRTDSLPATLPIRVPASRNNLPFSCSDSSVPANLDRGVGGRGLPAGNSKSRASSMKDTCPCPCGKVSAASHYSSCSHQPRDHRQQEVCSPFPISGQSPHGRQGGSLSLGPRGLQLVPRVTLLRHFARLSREEEASFFLLLHSGPQHCSEHAVQPVNEQLQRVVAFLRPLLSC